MKNIRLCCIALTIVLLMWSIFSAWTTAAQEQSLERCAEGVFSTEEDFFMTASEPHDGNPYISDGDLLTQDGDVCLRNAELLAPFGVEDDLGLDAVDILNAEKGVVAFSTELDSPNRDDFTAGDLLIIDLFGGSATVIPNAALVAPFEIGHNIGLDAVHFVGTPDSMLAFVERVQEVSRDEWLEDSKLLQSILTEFEIDIWFSIEGTWLRDELGILDGDVVSARNGSIVLTQFDLLGAAHPADVRQGGVDFGLDALTGSRDEDELASVLFSTEVLIGDTPRFNDGDVIDTQPVIFLDHGTLISPFVPAMDFVGLDALWLPYAGSPQANCEAEIFIVCPSDVPDLIAALNAANDEVNYPGANTITMRGGTYTLTVVDNVIGGSGNNGLPAVSSVITILGNGSTITRGAGSLRIFGVNINGNLTLNDLTLSNGDPGCQNCGGGGALLILPQGTATLNNTRIINNSAYAGGGIGNMGTLIMTGGSISNNTATTSSGGAIATVGMVSLDGVLIYNNTAMEGGAIFINGDTVDIRNSVIFNNTAVGTEYGGGGIYAYQNSVVTLDNTLFSENRAATMGCAIWNLSPSVVTIQNNTRFANNTCIDGGIAWGTGIINFNGATILGGNTSLYCTGGGTFNVGTGNTGDGIDLSCGF